MSYEEGEKSSPTHVNTWDRHRFLNFFNISILLLLSKRPEDLYVCMYVYTSQVCICNAHNTILPPPHMTCILLLIFHVCVYFTCMHM
jgi:hypothetical protein